MPTKTSLSLQLVSYPQAWGPPGSVANVPSEIPLVKVGFSFASMHQLQTAFFMRGAVSVSGTCAYCHNLCEFTCASVLLCLEWVPLRTPDTLWAVSHHKETNILHLIN